MYLCAVEIWGSDGTFPESYQYPYAPLWELRGLGTTRFSASSSIKSPSFALWASLVTQWLKFKKNLPTMEETRVQSLGWEDPQRRKWQPTPAFLHGKYHGQGSLAGYSPWGRKRCTELND